MHTKTHKGRHTAEIVRVVCQYVIVNTAWNTCNQYFALKTTFCTLLTDEQRTII